LYLLADVGFASTSLAAAWSPWGAVPGVIAALHLVVLAGLGAADDLVDQRLRLRRGFVIVVATGLVGVLAAESLGSALGEILRLSIALGVAVAAALTLATWPREAWGAVPTPLAGASEASTPDPADAIDVARLERLMLEERPYLDAELDLGRLSARLAMPPHRLRRLINRRLGYRNFADFLAEARLTEVKRRLADPALARRPILSIALESGFPSLATFNRVFKARENSTPSAFRRAALGAQSQKEATQDAE
jgi:AraC-like DNA-binding protein